MNKGKDYKFDDILQFALDNECVYNSKEVPTLP
jgi:hypothetical protein